MAPVYQGSHLGQCKWCLVPKCSTPWLQNPKYFPLPHPNQCYELTFDGFENPRNEIVIAIVSHTKVHCGIKLQANGDYITEFPSLKPQTSLVGTSRLVDYQLEIEKSFTMHGVPCWPRFHSGAETCEIADVIIITCSCKRALAIIYIRGFLAGLTQGMLSIGKIGILSTIPNQRSV